MDRSSTADRSPTALILDGSLAPGCVARLTLLGPRAGALESTDFGEVPRSLLERIAQLFPSPSSRADLAAIVVGVGPGSYTGIRAASAAAAGVAAALHLPVITVPSDRALYAAARDLGEETVVLPLGSREVLVIRETESVVTATADAPASADLAQVASRLPASFARLAADALDMTLAAAGDGVAPERCEIRLRYPSPPRGAEGRRP